MHPYEKNLEVVLNSIPEHHIRLQNYHYQTQASSVSHHEDHYTSAFSLQAINSYYSTVKVTQVDNGLLRSR